MKPATLYAKNLARFARFNPLEAFHLAKIDFSSLQFCFTSQNELNLIEILQNDSFHSDTFHFHSQQGALWEATSWSRILPLDSLEVLFVYGLGLGYYYLPLKTWLAENKKRTLVFLEEDPRVLCRFFETELATEILTHTQVMIKWLPCLLERNLVSFDELWEHLRLQAAPITWMFAQRPYHVSALQSYFASRFEFFHQFDLQWHMNFTQAERRIQEFLPCPNLSFTNFYANLPYLAEAKRADLIYGSCRSMPAIICGAGASLTKQLPTLATLKDRALIFAAGSSMNALTQAQIMPHAGGAIDPHPTQASRQLTSFAFDVPIFYQNGFYAKALRQWHGPRLYVTSKKTGFHVAEWFESELGLQSDSEIIMGVSTSNFLVEIAGLLGCNPIILVGMDLAYTENVRYAKGISAHPTDDKIEHQALKHKEEHLLSVLGLDGTQVFTKHEWFLEAICMAGFKVRNPTVNFLNATEGGMPIQLIPNVSLQASCKQSSPQWEMQGWLHGLIQMTTSCKIDFERLMQAIGTWKKSLENCLTILDNLSHELEANQARLKSNQLLPHGPYSGRASLWQIELEAELVYAPFLATLDTLFDTLHKRQQYHCKFFLKGKKQALTSLLFELKRCTFLRQYVSSHLLALKEGMKSYQTISQELASHSQTKERLATPLAPPDYFHGNNQLRVIEPSLDVYLEAFFNPQRIPSSQLPTPQRPCKLEALICERNQLRDGQTLYFYPNGQIKAEAFYLAGQLHGPWTFYSQNGGVLAKTWYIEGKKQGRSCYYYSNGALYSMQGHKDDLPHGEHLYYYEDGTLKTRENFKEGVFDGIVQLYYRNGQLQREEHFLKGKLHGIERMWNEAGKLIVEAFYEHNQPSGTARKWDDQGRLLKEIHE